MKFTVKLPVTDMFFVYQAFDTDAENSILLNGVQVARLPAQNQSHSGSWTESQQISLPTSFVQQDANILQVCSESPPNPDFTGDVDDFELQGIEIIVKH